MFLLTKVIYAQTQDQHAALVRGRAGRGARRLCRSGAASEKHGKSIGKWWKTIGKYITIHLLVGGIPTPLKNHGVRQLGWWHSQYDGKIMFQSTNQRCILLYSWDLILFIRSYSYTCSDIFHYMTLYDKKLKVARFWTLGLRLLEHIWAMNETFWMWHISSLWHDDCDMRGSAHQLDPIGYFLIFLFPSEFHPRFSIILLYSA